MIDFWCFTPLFACLYFFNTLRISITLINLLVCDLRQGLYNVIKKNKKIDSFLNMINIIHFTQLILVDSADLE